MWELLFMLFKRNETLKEAERLRSTPHTLQEAEHNRKQKLLHTTHPAEKFPSEMSAMEFQNLIAKQPNILNNLKGQK